MISEGFISVYFTNQMRIALLGLYGIDKKVLEQEYRRNSLRALGLLVSVHTHRDAYQTTYIHTHRAQNQQKKENFKSHTSLFFWNGFVSLKRDSAQILCFPWRGTLEKRWTK